MRWLLTLPFPVLVLLAYNALVLPGGKLPAATLTASVISMSLASGAAFTLTVGELLLLIGALALFIEIA